MTGNQDNAVGIAIGWTINESELESRYGREFSLFHVVQTGSRAHPAFYPAGTGGSFLWIKHLEREADHSPLTSAEVIKTWIYKSIPSCFVMHSAQLSTGTTLSSPATVSNSC
jgi:hypothetical protein